MSREAAAYWMPRSSRGHDSRCEASARRTTRSRAARERRLTPARIVRRLARDGDVAASTSPNGNQRKGTALLDRTIGKLSSFRKILGAALRPRSTIRTSLGCISVIASTLPCAASAPVRSTGSSPWRTGAVSQEAAAEMRPAKCQMDRERHC